MLRSLTPRPADAWEGLIDTATIDRPPIPPPLAIASQPSLESRAFQRRRD